MNCDYTETKFVHKTGHELTTKVYLVLDKNMQGVGSAITYAKRYGILTLAGIEPETKDDDDGNKASGVGKQETKIQLTIQSSERFGDMSEKKRIRQSQSV